jgi:alpha-amylase/alpha-mannosidase (GH57 family)
MKPVRLALLWHMHQPLYREPETGEYLMPWVRLHATRAYNDMAWILERHPGVRCTVNFVPVLLEQLDDYVSGRARDRFLDLTLRPAPDLALEERAAIIRSFFMVDWETNIQPLPRYWELLQKRGRDPAGADLDRLAHAFTDADITDLQVLFNLAWMGFGALADEPALQGLRRKGRDFTRDDVEVLAANQVRILAGIVPRWRALVERGQVELSATPYYHPILPLVCDTDAARRALPDLPLPPRFAHPEDARWHVREALQSHARRFGTPPAGMWPAEGSVSPEALAVLASEGVRWAGSDEGVLLRSLPAGTNRMKALYRPWRVDAGPGGELSMLFRDRNLSDVIGFTYAKVAARHAAQDFTTHVRAVGEAWAAERQPGPATVGVFLDGENAWEHYPASGHEFLDQLYATLEASAEIETVTMSEAVADAPGPAIPRIHSGSWIESSYRIWIGHSEDRQAWTALGAARDQLDAAVRAGTVEPEKLERARRHLYAAEGSDWYWWFGDDFATDQAAEFDSLFRGQVIRASLLLGANPPAEALTPIKRMDGRQAPSLEAKPLREPSLLLTPKLDGRETTYFEWQGSGLYQPGQHRGSMYGGAQAFNVLRYGFDLEALYLRLDPAESPIRAAEVASHLKVELLGPEGQVWVDFELHPDGHVRAGHRRGEPLGELAFDTVAELRLPFAALGLTPGTKVALCVHALREEVEVERLPRYGYVAFPIPDRDFERLNWRV